MCDCRNCWFLSADAADFWAIPPATFLAGSSPSPGWTGQYLRRKFPPKEILRSHIFTRPAFLRLPFYPSQKGPTVDSHTLYLSRTQGRCPRRKNLSCGEISNSCTWQMWRSLKFIPMWINFKFLRMTDVEKSEISFNMCTINGILLHFKLFCCKICVFLAIYAVLSQNWFIAIYAIFGWRKILSKNSVRGEKWQIWGMRPVSSSALPHFILLL